MADSKQRRNNIKVLIFPWLAHGHITPFLELAKKLTLRSNFHIYFCSSPVNLNSIKPKLFSDPKFSTRIELVELHLPSLPSLPPHHHTTKGLPPHLLSSLHKALDLSKPNFSNILQTLKPDLLIHDFFPPWVPSVASSMNIPSVLFINSGASLISFVIHRCKNRGNYHDYPYPEIFPDSMETKIAIALERASTDYETITRFYESCGDILLIKSFKELDGKYIDLLSSLLEKKIVPVGILVPDPVQDQEGIDIVRWLDMQEKCSTVFVSFGSECYLSKEDMEEMARGLELSKVKFIWVIRFPEGDEKVKIEEALPSGFLESVKEKGLVVENWAPQMKILNHSSIGGFVSHCGWGSLTESIKFGVPIIATPMQFEQPWNARLIEECGIGLEVKRDIINDGLQRENIAQVIKQVVVEKVGDDIRRKVKEMSNNIKRKGDIEIIDEVVKQLLEIL